MAMSLYDDPQINGDDYRKAAQWGNYSTDDIQIDADAEVFINEDDGAYVQAWIFVSAEDALDKARDRQATAFNAAMSEPESAAYHLGRADGYNRNCPGFTGEWVAFRAYHTGYCEGLEEREAEER